MATVSIQNGGMEVMHWGKIVKAHFSIPQLNIKSLSEKVVGF